MCGGVVGDVLDTTSDVLGTSGDGGGILGAVEDVGQAIGDVGASFEKEVIDPLGGYKVVAPVTAAVLAPYAIGALGGTAGAASGAAAADAAFVAADAASLAAQGLSEAAIAQNLTAAGVSSIAAADAAALDSTFYSHGKYVLKANNDVIMPYRGLFNHWYKGQTQQTAALGAASPDDQIRGAEDGMITAEPNIVLIGSKNYQPTIELPTALASAAAFERCILIYRGILAQNSTVVS